MSDSKAFPNQVTYRGGLFNGQLVLTSVEFPSEFVGEDGKVIMTCESVATGEEVAEQSQQPGYVVVSMMGSPRDVLPTFPSSLASMPDLFQEVVDYLLDLFIVLGYLFDGMNCGIPMGRVL